MFYYFFVFLFTVNYLRVCYVYAQTSDSPANNSQIEYDGYDYCIGDIQDKDDMKKCFLLEEETDVEDNLVSSSEQDDYEYILGVLEDDEDTVDAGLDLAGNNTLYSMFGNSNGIQR